MVNENELKNLQVIKASAGSGKTYNLARTYIQHLLGRRRVVGGAVRYELRHARNYQSHLLAITFTVKATAEMKSRIVKELYDLGSGKGEYMDYLDALFVDSREDIAQAARVALSDILFNYTTFNVSTIDSFFQSIVRTFARELNAAYNYELQLDADYATAIAVNDFLRDLGGNGPEERLAGRWVREYIRNNIDNDRDWNFFGRSKDLVGFAENINKEFFRACQKDLTAYLDDVEQPDSHVSRFVKKLGTAAAAHKAAYAQLPSQLRDFFAALGVAENDIKVAGVKTLMNLPDGVVPDKLTDALCGYAGNSDALTKNVIRKEATTGLPAQASLDFAEIMAAAVAHYDRWVALEAVRRNMWNLGLLDRIARHLEQYRRDNNTLLMADTNDLISTVLGSGIEFIYEHVGVWINNFMIDEFQDTSRKQYENFKPLLNGAISMGHQNLIIGDEKQAIYRFRNSDVAMLRDEIEKDFNAHDIGGKPLETNYRSQCAIVEFNNRFFEAALGHFDPNRFAALNKTYAHIVQKIDKDDVPGVVKIHFEYTGNQNSDGDDDAAGDSLAQLPAYINALRHRKFEQRDIAILVNRGEEGRKVIAQILRHNETCSDEREKINVVSSDSLALETSSAVKLIMSVLTSLEAARETIDEDEDEAGERGGISKLDRQLAEQRRHKIVNAFNKKLAVTQDTDAGQLLLQCFEEDEGEKPGGKQENLTRLQNYYNAVVEVLPDGDREQSSLVAIVDRIIDLYLGNATSSENAFILAFQDLVVDFLSQNNGGTVREFIKFWNSKGHKTTISSPEGTDAVKVMTIHKSKGLQFPCVIIPFANWELIDSHHNNLLWVTKERWLNAGGKNVPLEGIGGADDSIVPPIIPLTKWAINRIPEFASFYDSEVEKDLIDNLNKTYVAFTRPEEELHIFASLSPSSAISQPEPPKTVAQMLSTVAGQVEGVKVMATTQVKVGRGKKQTEVTLPAELVMGEAREKVPRKKDDDAPSQRTMSPYRVGYLPETVTVALPPVPTLFN